MAKDWSEHNNRVFKVGLSSFVKNIELKLVKISEQTADEVLRYIDDSRYAELPVWTSNLADSTGLGVYRDSVLTRFAPPKRATESQGDADNDIYNIIGAYYLERALSDGSILFSDGIWLVLYSAVPYAEKVNVDGSPAYQGMGFFDNIADEAERIVTLSLAVEFPNAIR